MKKIACLFLLAVYPAVFLCAQKIEAALNTQLLHYTAEKIYIQYDKDYYAAGETAWFKAYLYMNGQPSQISNNFYLQLCDNKGTILLSQKYPVKGASVSGYIPLPDTLSEGTYWVRALTPYMSNSDPAFHYFKPLFVFNRARRESAPVVNELSSQLSLRFFPEGGALTADILSAIAFAATDGTGKPAAISGIIKTDDTVTVTTIQTTHEGIGKFQFKPRPGKIYTAVVTRNGLTSYFPLPEAAPSGTGLRVENEKGGKAFTISRSRKDKERFAKVRLVAQMNNRIVYDTEIEFDNYFQVKGHLLTDSMPSGILHFTLFDENNLPLAERLSFVNNGEYLSKGRIEIIKNGTGKREENILEIKFDDAMQRSLSVSVTDPSVSSFTGKENMVSSFLLTSDLRGTIYNPSWYFQEGNDSLVVTALDNLMLTHGWSRFSWKKILAGEFPERKIQDPYLIEIPGIVKDSKTKEPQKGGRISFFVESEDSATQHFDIPVDNNGRFTVDSLLIRGKSKVFFGYTNQQGAEKNADLSLFTHPTDSTIATLTINKEAAAEQTNLYAGLYNDPAIAIRVPEKKSKLEETKDLDPVIVKAKEYKRPIDEVNAKYTSGVFTSMGRSNFDFINQPENNRSLSVYDFARRSIRQITEQGGEFVNQRNFDLFDSPNAAQQIQLDKNKDTTRLANAGNPNGDDDFFKPEYTKGKHFVVGIYLNESPAFIGILKTIRMDEVALIKFYEPGFIGSGATESPGGVLSVYTRKYEAPKGEVLEKLDNTSYNGYALVKEFYSPDYATAATTGTPADTRTTLYWNPELYTGSDTNTVQLKFYNNDISKRFKVIIEGFDNKGHLVHIERIQGD
ncbi:MAG: hypothetical protein NTW29_10025 [Bacteroidetes bacterium]|nr:hypothetical protein [Bacteroidota bacterium]